MTLLYVRHNLRHEVGGAMFGYSADTSENAFHEVVPVLRGLFPSTKWAAEKKWRRDAAQWTPDGVDFLIVDSFETPVRRPSVNEREKRIYSGKKKRHTLKTQVITDQDGAVLSSAPGHRGPQADLKLYEESPLPEPVADKAVVGDKAYQSSTHPELTTPHKKPKGGALTAAQLASNKELAAQRVSVEHGIGRVKAFRILRLKAHELCPKRCTRKEVPRDEDDPKWSRVAIELFLRAARHRRRRAGDVPCVP